ncbi:hypothetical protein ACLOJK_031250 [Asimina triloba]
MAESPLGNPNSNVGTEGKPKVVVVMGATGAGKSRLAIDLASFFPVEIINADSMQVYEGLDVLTNKVPLEDRRGVPHHLLGTISANVDFTSKDFRDQAIPWKAEIGREDEQSDLILNHFMNSFDANLPVIVGGTNYYIQLAVWVIGLSKTEYSSLFALVSPFLVDDLIDVTDIDDTDGCNQDGPPGERRYPKGEKGYCWASVARVGRCERQPSKGGYINTTSGRADLEARLKLLVNHYISLYEGSGVLPSKLFQGNALQNL